ATVDELTSDVVKISANHLRLRTDPKDIVPRSADQGTLPSSGDRTERVPGMTGDQAKLRGFNPQLLLDVAIRLARGLVVLDAIRAETPLEKIGNAAVLKLARLHFQQVVGQGEKPEASI